MHQPVAGPAHPGLHLVDPEQRAVRVADLAGPGQVAGRRHDDAVLALDRLEDHGGGLVVDRCGKRLGVAVRDEDHVAGQRLERLAVLRVVGDRQRPHRPAVERALARDDLGPPGQPGDLERGLVGLGAGVGEEHPCRRRRRTIAASRSASATWAGVAKKFETCPRVAICPVIADSTVGWAWPSAFTASPESRSR